MVFNDYNIASCHFMVSIETEVRTLNACKMPIYQI